MDSDSGWNRRPQRAVLNNARRKVERALAVWDAGEELAEAAEQVLNSADSEAHPARLDALRAALEKYRRMR